MEKRDIEALRPFFTRIYGTYLRLPQCQLSLSVPNEKESYKRTLFLPQVHHEWVYKVKYWHSLGYVISCSADENNSLHLADINGRMKASSLKIRKGVMSFDFCKEWNIIGQSQ